MNQSMPLVTFPSSEGFNAYRRAINDAPILSLQRERELALRYRNDDDLDAARELVMSHLRFVVKVARGFMGYGFPLTDLVQEGSIGLMKAVKRYDPNRDVRLVSFAVHWIKAEIYDYVVRNFRVAKIATTKAQRKLLFNLRKSHSRLGWMNNREVEQLATKLNVKTDTVRQMEARLSSSDIAFDPQDQDDESIQSPAQWIGDNRYNPATLADKAQRKNGNRKQLMAAMERLDKRSYDIIYKRWLSDDTAPALHELAVEYGVSAERIRQIEKRALEKMKGLITI